MRQQQNYFYTIKSFLLFLRRGKLPTEISDSLSMTEDPILKDLQVSYGGGGIKQFISIE